MAFLKHLIARGLMSAGRYFMTLWRLPIILKKLEDQMEQKSRISPYIQFCPNPDCGKQMHVDKGTGIDDHWRYHCRSCNQFFSISVFQAHQRLLRQS